MEHGVCLFFVLVMQDFAKDLYESDLELLDGGKPLLIFGREFNCSLVAL